jgi:exodeoxyribonuclease VII small subunit
MPKPDSPDAGRSQSDIFAGSSDVSPPTGDAAPTSAVSASLGAQPDELSGGADSAGRGAASEAALEPMPTSFESALGELEEIVAHMESGELSLEQSLAAYKRGAMLLQYCQGKLHDAQQQVKILEAGVLRDFSGAGENGQ